jgi:hypothetical protein
MSWVKENVYDPFTGKTGQEAAEKGAAAQTALGREGIAEQRAARESFEKRVQPFADIGLDAGKQLSAFLSNPNAGIEQIAPLVDFLRNQGFEKIQESAAAGGRLGAGGTLRDLTQFNTDLTSTVVPQLQNQRFNQLFNVMGAGQNAATGQGTAALSTANNIGNLLGNIGNAQVKGFDDVARAREQGSANIINLATGMAGGMGGGGGGMGGGGGGMGSTMSTFSDRRLKRSIKRIRSDENGGIYRFKYIGSDRTYIGRMADDLAIKRPDAVSVHCTGFMQVSEEFRARAI